MKLSVVSTLYNSADYIEEFCDRVSKTAREMAGESFEIILVNDGSPDNSLEIAKKVFSTNSHIKIIDLSRNFGHHKAMMTGLGHSHGEWVYLIDIDLEEEPEWLVEFKEHADHQRVDVVYGVQSTRKGNSIERISGEWFYSLFNLLTNIQLPRNIVTARLMKREYVNALLEHKEREVFLAGIWHITGFKQVPQTITKHNTSESTYSLRSKLSILVNSITSFSNTPLVAIFYIGVLIFISAISYTSYLIVKRLFFVEYLEGWTSVMASIWLIGGMIISFIGVIGIYLSKVYSETKQRPYTIIRKVYEQ